jgi:hypothetical protein
MGIEHDGPVVITRRLFKFGSAVPEIIKKMVPAGMLEMVDTNYFNTETYVSRFTMHSSEVLFCADVERVRLHVANFQFNR